MVFDLYKILLTKFIRAKGSFSAKIKRQRNTRCISVVRDNPQGELSMKGVSVGVFILHCYNLP